MSARDFEPAMLILSRGIYAKRRDDSFYPGTIESKLPDGSYFVHFADGGKEIVQESEITWLGFWGLPPYLWPRNPVVQTADPAANLHTLEQFRNIGSKKHPANSVPFRTSIRETDWHFDGFSEANSKLSASDVSEYQNSAKMNRNSQDVISAAHVSPNPVSENQTRTSVIRICSNGSLREEDSKSEEFSSAENNFESPAFRPSYHSTSSNNEKSLNFDEHKTVLQNINSDSSFRKRKRSMSSEYEECSIKEKYTRSEHIENKHRNSSPFHKLYPTSTSPRPFVSPHFEDYGSHSVRLSMYDSTSPQRPVSFRLQTRARRRSENKKCRKVYGVENRDIWCTQCKWKKACTRFAGTEKCDRTGLMYLTDYERFQL